MAYFKNINLETLATDYVENGLETVKKTETNNRAAKKSDSKTVSTTETKAANTKEKKEEHIKTSDSDIKERHITYKPLFDLSDPRLIKIRRKDKGSGKGRSVSIYLSSEVSRTLDYLCDVHYMTKSELISTLILNSK